MGQKLSSGCPGRIRLCCWKRSGASTKFVDRSPGLPASTSLELECPCRRGGRSTPRALRRRCRGGAGQPEADACLATPASSGLVVRMAMPPWLRLSVSAAAMVLPNRYATGMPSTTRGLLRRLKLSGNRCGASDGRMCCTALYSLTYPATPSAASSRTSSALAIVPLKTRIGSRPSSSLRMPTGPARRPAGAAGAGRAPPGRSSQVGAHARQQLRGALDGDRPVARLLERRPEPVADERRVVGDDDGLGGDGLRAIVPGSYRNGTCAAVPLGVRCSALQSALLAIIRTFPREPRRRRPGLPARPGFRVGRAAPPAKEEGMATCPECDADVEVDEYDVDKGDISQLPRVRRRTSKSTTRLAARARRRRPRKTKTRRRRRRRRRGRGRRGRRGLGRVSGDPNDALGAKPSSTSARPRSAASSRASAPSSSPSAAAWTARTSPCAATRRARRPRAVR